jgi:hypothetical protein
MAKTYVNVLDEAREILQDTQEPYRYSDTILINILNRALQEVGRIRPDAFWSTFVTDDIVVPEVTVPTLSSTFPIPMQFYLPVVSFVVAWAEVLDDEFTVDGRAAMLIAQFKQELTGL